MAAFRLAPPGRGELAYRSGSTDDGSVSHRGKGSPPRSRVFVNYSSQAKDRGLILHTTVGIGYEVPWRQVQAMLLEATKRTRGIITSRDPFVLRGALGDFAITYE